MSNLLDTLRTFCTQFAEGSTCWIAYSGGLDSHVLLALCHQLRTEIKLHFRVVHIHHGLSENADAWANHCRHTAEQYGMDYIQYPIDLDLQAGESLEAVARKKRYAIFADLLSAGDVLLTAHHQDDQAETVLLQLMRGAGVKGLAAMPRLKPFANGYHGRPLLAFARTVLQHYASEHQLRWIEDESNQNVQLARNYIRHEILPALTSRWPSATASIARSAAHCAENQGLLEVFTAEVEVKGSRESTLSVTKLLQCSCEMQRGLLRAWIHQSGFPLPDTKKMHTIQRNVLQAVRDSMPVVQWGEVSLRRHRDDLHLVPVLPTPDTAATHIWNMQQEYNLPHLGVLKASLVQGGGLHPDLTTVSVCFRVGGEKLELKGRGRHRLKTLFQEWDVLPWERDSMPLIFVGDKLIAIPGYFLHAEVTARQDELGWEIRFERGKNI